ncbi:MAG TPA: amidohydrolase family protein [Gemmatimonadales bacterium]|nr:amidohydrolase family protein [Gemmatimonadales bacterium]
MSGLPLVDVHVHFWHDRCGRAEWRELNARRLAIGERIGITLHIASILGTWGYASPTYFPSPDDVSYGNEAMRAIEAAHPDRVRGYTTVNPNFTAHAVREIEIGADHGLTGIKLAASRRADDPLLDPVCELADHHRVPILHHVWQHRRGEVPGQEISDALDLAALSSRWPRVQFILAHIGGGGDWAHSLRALAQVPNIWVDLSGSGVDRGMLELCLECVGPGRLLWGTDLTMDTGLAKLKALELLCSPAEFTAIRWRNAARIFHLVAGPRSIAPMQAGAGAEA